MYRPEMTLHVLYNHRNKPADANTIQGIILAAYNKEPWKLDGAPEPLCVYLTDVHHGTAVGEFAARAGFLHKAVKPSQQAAFERMCRRIAKTLAESAYTWCTGCSVQLNVSYETIDGEIFSCR